MTDSRSDVLEKELPMDADFYIDIREWRVHADPEAAFSRGCVASDLIAAYKALPSKQQPTAPSAGEREGMLRGLSFAEDAVGKHDRSTALKIIRAAAERLPAAPSPETGARAVAEKIAEIRAKNGARPCDCTSCDCGNSGDTYSTGSWDGTDWALNELAASLPAQAEDSEFCPDVPLPHGYETLEPAEGGKVPEGKS